MTSVEDSILHSIKKNGYPDKRVSLPFQSVFKACKNEKVALSDVLKKLETDEVFSRIDNDKIIFFSRESAAESTKDATENSSGFDFSNRMVSEAMKKLEGMDPKEMERLKKQVMDMSPEEREELLKKAQSFFSKSSS